MNATSAQTIPGQRMVVSEKLARQREYHRPDRIVKPPHRIFPGRQDRSPAQPARAPSAIHSQNSASITSLSLFLLLLGLQGCHLPARCKGPAWSLVDQWARQVVGTHTSVEGESI